MAWNHEYRESAYYLAERLAMSQREVLNIVREKQLKNPALAGKYLAQAVAHMMVEATLEIRKEIGEGADRDDLGWAGKIGRAKALMDTAYQISIEIKAAGLIIDNLGKKGSEKVSIQLTKRFSAEAGLGPIETGRVRNLSLDLKDMTEADTELSATEKSLGGFAKADLTPTQLGSMSDQELAKNGMYRVPGYTKSDGTKVKTHFRKRPTATA